MIAIHHHRLNFWLRLKLLLTLGGHPTTTAQFKQSAPKRKPRTHRTTAFFEMP